MAVLLATYQGERFLHAQLESLERQTHRNWRLYWRDDGSADATCGIMAAFAARRDIVRVDGNMRLGAPASFLTLLRAAGEECEYFAFCDQDDVWFADKIGRALAFLRGEERAALYCGRQSLVDGAGRVIGNSAVPRRALGFRNALAQNVVTGCTAVMNRAARAAILAAPPMPDGSFHDWWSYLVVSAAGGRILYDPEPKISYRQHEANVVGANANVWIRGRRALVRGAGPFARKLHAHVQALRGFSGASAENRAVLAALQGLAAGGVAARLHALWRARLYRQTIAEDVLMYLWIALSPADL